MNVLASPISDPPDGSPEPFAVSATVSLQERRSRTIKSGDTFGVFDHGGDIVALRGGTDGLYHRDTRYLSRFDMTIGGMRPLLLSSTLGADNVMLTSDLSNASTTDLGTESLEQGLIHIQRSLFLSNGACYERLQIRNFAVARHYVRLDLRFDADFADLFEVRGMQRERRGERLPAVIAPECVTLSYRGLDGEVRATRLCFEPAPETLTAGCASFGLDLEPHGLTTIFLQITCAPEGPAAYPPRAAFLDAYVRAKRMLRAIANRSATIASRNEEFDETARRAASDLRMLITEKPTGPYPYAGIPWFSTAFGRDALITALLTLSFDPALARGVLRYLAQEQATEFDPASEAEPGKILHEMRGGEMAALREVPFRRYYGSVDATPLFVMLAGAYLDRTGDLAAVQALWPNLARALDWIDRRADADGFVAYQRTTEEGLANQGWKDSYDSVSHADGALARGAIALCEVQGYVYRRPPAPGPPSPAGSGSRTEAARLEQQGGQPAPGVRGAVLVRAAGHLRAGAGWRRPAVRGAVLQRRAPAADGHRVARPGAAGRRRADVVRLLHRVGDPHPCRRRAALQPDVVPQRLRLAARQRDDRAGDGAGGHAGGNGQAVRGDARRVQRHGSAAAAGIVLRVPPPAWSGSDLLPGGVLAPGLGRGDASGLRPGVPRVELQCGHPHGAFRPPHAAAFPGPAEIAQSVPGRRQHQRADPARTQRGFGQHRRAVRRHPGRHRVLAATAGSPGPAGATPAAPRPDGGRFRDTPAPSAGR